MLHEMGKSHSICPEGAGIAPGLLTRIKRGEELTTKVAGNGLGLISVIDWADQNGVAFDLDSELNGGTLAKLRIPKSQ
jgi:hypothetical protein